MAEQQTRAPSGNLPSGTDLPGYATRGREAENFTRSLAKLLERSVRAQRDTAKSS
jgi:hypothetical protein